MTALDYLMAFAFAAIAGTNMLMAYMNWQIARRLERAARQMPFPSSPQFRLYREMRKKEKEMKWCVAFAVINALGFIAFAVKIIYA